MSIHSPGALLTFRLSDMELIFLNIMLQPFSVHIERIYLPFIPICFQFVNKLGSKCTGCIVLKSLLFMSYVFLSILFHFCNFPFPALYLFLSFLKYTHTYIVYLFIATFKHETVFQEVAKREKLAKEELIHACPCYRHWPTVFIFQLAAQLKWRKFPADHGECHFTLNSNNHLHDLGFYSLENRKNLAWPSSDQ